MCTTVYSRKCFSPKRQAISWIVTLCTLLAFLLPATIVQSAPLTTSLAAAPAEPTVTTSVELIAVEDQGMIESIPTFIGGGAPYFVLNGRPDPSSEDWNFIQFDLATLPADATIIGAQLKLDVVGFGGPARELEVGRADGDWEEGVTNWNTMPTVTWTSNVQTITTTGDVTWPLKPLVEAWHNGTVVNNGVVVRTLENGNNAGSQARTKDGAGDLPPRLVIHYTLPADDGQPRPDLGDAPDSSNHHAQPNTAYVAGGVLGQFPTVWNVPVGQVAGPRHVNQTMEGWLGNFISREAEADLGPDQDAPRNNILRNTVTGAIGDVADNDRGDDGWRNRTIKFFDCQRTSLDVRVSKSLTATRNTMYLNVWFDGNRDGDWQDLGQCQQDEEDPAQASYEWIVQNYIIDMTAIAPAGSLDFAVITEKVFNATPAMPHWMRFTLSEELAVQAGGQLPDGRGPHPDGALKSFKFGETEDIFQKPAPAGEDGTLEIEKRVITNGEPVEWIDYVTYEIKLRHNGGSQPLQARMRDVLPYPLVVYPTVDGSGIHYVVVESPTGGAVPLQAQLDVIPPSGGNPPQQVVKWQGTLAPDAEVKFTFQVRVIALCQPNQNTMEFTNTATAKPQAGTVVSASDTFTAKCIDYDDNNIEFEAHPITHTLDLDDLIHHYPWSGNVFNAHPYTVTLGFYQTLSGTVAASAVQQPKLLDQITLGANETQPLDIVLRMEQEFSDELKLPDDYTPTATLSFCFMPDEASGCPNEAQYPQLHGHIPFTLTVRPNDLGDAPDSSNHTVGANMLAYPNGTQANFPTVFDPATGLPQGPRHSFPRPFHLGQWVSREAEADGGPDQDALNNIVPPANNPDNDRFDDGTNLALWNLNHCQTTNLPVKVAISPQAVNYFQQLGTPGYLNIWLDSNRDGDWADAAQCGQNPAPEHIVIDFPINVVGLGAGLHLVNVPTGLVPWQITDVPAWVRITLSERPSNKTLNAGAVNYGDGRGYPIPFKTGETEDYYYRSEAAGGGPDLAVQMIASSQLRAQQLPDLQAAAVDKLGNFEIQMFKIDYENIGTTGILSALLEFQIPEKFHGVQPVLARGTDVSMESISFNFGQLSLVLPTMEPNAGGSIVLGWYGCITCTLANNVAAATAADTNLDYTASVSITVEGDVDPSNNSATATARGLLSSPIIGAFMDYTDDACMDRILHGPVVTNQSTVELRGKAKPNSIIAILIGLLKIATVNSDGNGNFSYSANLEPGLQRIHAEYANQVGAAEANIKSPRDSASGQATGIILKVDPTLPFDPMSLCFVDSQGHSISLPQMSFDTEMLQLDLRSGETYTVSVDGMGDNLNQYFKVTFADVVLSSLLDEDGDGTYTGWATFPSSVSAASVNASGKLGLLVGDGANESSYSAEIATASDGVISNRATGQPVANASVSALIAQSTSEGDTIFAAWEEAQSGQSNPQVTGNDGQYSYNASSGIYRIDVLASGYQPYRSGDIDASAESLARDIALSPVISEATTQTIFITENGFEPATLTVQPNAVIEFVNLDTDEHTTQANGWESGMLRAGQSYKVKVTALGTIAYDDSNDVANNGTIIVSEAVAEGNQVYLPVVSR